MVTTVSDRVALWILGFVAVLEAVNVAVALAAHRPTLAAVDLMFTTTGGAILTDVLARRHREHQKSNGNGAGDGTAK